MGESSSFPHCKGVEGRTRPPFVFGKSSYTFYNNSVAQKRAWTESRQHCKHIGSDLVSIESEKEWKLLKTTIQAMATVECYIGLKKDSKSGEWKWISDNSKVNATRGKFPWAKGEPAGDGNCAIIYRDYRQDYGLFNDFPCNRRKTYSGYICESPTESTDQEVPTVGKTSARTESKAGTKTTLRQSLAVTSATPLSLSTKALSKEATPQTERGNKESNTNPTIRQSTSSKHLLTESNSKELTATAKAMKGGRHSDDKGGCCIMVKILASLLAMSYAALLILAVIFYSWQKKQRKEIDTSKTTDRGNQLDDEDNLSLSLENAARQLGFSDEEKPKGARRDNQKRETDQSSRQDCGYAMLTPRTTMVTGDGPYASLVKSKQEHCNSKYFVAASSLLPHNEKPHNGLPTYVNVRRRKTNK